MRVPRRLTIVIPMRNERDAVEPLFEKLSVAARSWSDTYRILVKESSR